MTVLHVGQRRIFYDASGTGNPLVLLQGSPPGRGFWTPMVTALSPYLRVITLDNRDAGESDAATEPYTIADLAADAAHVLANLGIARAHVLGFSMGGMTAVQLALSYPAVVDHLILMGAALRTDESDNHQVRERQAGAPPPPPAPWWSDDPLERARRAMAAMASPTYHATLTPEVIDTIATLDEGNRITWAGSLRQGEAMVSHTGHVHLEQIAAPTLVIHGELDNVSDAQEYAARIPGARLLILPQAGHIVHFEQPDDVYDAVLTFLGVHR